MQYKHNSRHIVLVQHHLSDIITFQKKQKKTMHFLQIYFSTLAKTSETNKILYISTQHGT